MTSETNVPRKPNATPPPLAGGARGGVTRLLWFVALYVAGVAAVGMVALLVHAVAAG